MEPSIEMVLDREPGIVTEASPDRERERRKDGSGEIPSGRQSQRASAVDRHVGVRIRDRRLMMGLSQQQLASMIGVTCQQAHKYERGLNRISAGRMFEIAQVLGVSVSYFFEDIAPDPSQHEVPSRQRMCLELARNFALINNEKHQEALSRMARALAAQSQAQVERQGTVAREA